MLSIPKCQLRVCTYTGWGSTEVRGFPGPRWLTGWMRLLFTERLMGEGSGMGQREGSKRSFGQADIFSIVSAQI